MNLRSKNVLTINLTKQEAVVKNMEELHPFIGGVGIGLKLLEIYKDKKPLIFSVGPLNGFFPYASKTSLVLEDNGVVEDIYLGGNLSTRIKYSGLDAIVIHGTADNEITLDIHNNNVTFIENCENPSSLGLPGKKSTLVKDNEKALLNEYFTTPGDFLENEMRNKNLKGFTITGTEIYKVPNQKKYQQIYADLLSKQNLMSVEKNSYPSCAGCPMGCGKSKTGEIGGNVLLHSLVACEYSGKIYSDIGISFSCLNILGYDYTHEDIENLPASIEKTIREMAAL